MPKILMVEDDPVYARNTCDWLEMEKHVVEIATSGAEALARLAVYSFDLVILDFQLPDANGPEILRSFRDRGGRTPVLMLTVRQTLSDKESGFAAGADDYLDKASHPRELSMRVSALLRRPPTYTVGLFKFGTLILNPNSGTVTRKGEPVHLLPKEYALLFFLLRHQERVFTAEELLDKVWPSESEANAHTVRSCINRIRQKLDEPDQSSIINTVRGLGYGLNDELRTSGVE